MLAKKGLTAVVTNEQTGEVRVLNIGEGNKLPGIADPQAGLSSRINSTANSADILLRNAFVYDDDAYPTLRGSELEMSSKLSRRALMDPDNPRNQIRQKKQETLVQYLKDIEADEEAYKEQLEAFYDQRKNRWRQAGWTMAMHLGLGWHASAKGKKSMSGPMFESPDWWPFAKGGLNAKDDVPALLTAGEYVMNRDAVRKYGTSLMSKLNRGQNISTFAEGGSVGNIIEPGAGGLSSGPQTNNINITVNVDQAGAVDAKISADRPSSSLESQEEARSFSRQIENAVVKVILDQKRQGGLLS
jgi:hypothetical protein